MVSWYFNGPSHSRYLDSGQKRFFSAALELIVNYRNLPLHTAPPTNKNVIGLKLEGKTVNKSGIYRRIPCTNDTNKTSKQPSASSTSMS
jgi:hypothetical protein